MSVDYMGGDTFLWNQNDWKYALVQLDFIPYVRFCDTFPVSVVSIPPSLPIHYFYNNVLLMEISSGWWCSAYSLKLNDDDVRLQLHCEAKPSLV